MFVCSCVINQLAISQFLSINSLENMKSNKNLTKQTTNHADIVPTTRTLFWNWCHQHHLWNNKFFYDLRLQSYWQEKFAENKMKGWNEENRKEKLCLILRLKRSQMQMLVFFFNYIEICAHVKVWAQFYQICRTK